jgi:hypothetical protein
MEMNGRNSSSENGPQLLKSASPTGAMVVPNGLPEPRCSSVNQMVVLKLSVAEIFRLLQPALMPSLSVGLA